MDAPPSLYFLPFRLELGNDQLWKEDKTVPLRRKTSAVLRYLVDHPGQLVTKEQVLAAVWPGTYVEEGALTICIAELRKALGDNSKTPRFIETVHGRGYRFLPTVTTQPLQSSKFRVPSSKTQHSGLNAQHSLLVGRESELAQLHVWLAKALSGERQIVFVTGEPGIGKTTVVDAFLIGIRQQRTDNGKTERPQATGRKPRAKGPNPRSPTLDPWISWGQCIEQYGQGEPYMPILEALGRLCQEPGGKRLIALLTQHAPTWLVQLPTLLSAADLEALQRKTQRATRERMLRELGEAVEVLTAERPLVLWLEDLHWSDASTLELLALLARRREPARLLVIGTYRPVDVMVQEHPLRVVKQELQLHGQCRELPLGLLSETQVAEYLAQRFNVGTTGRLPLQPLAKAIHRRTDGNPLFLVTAVDDLVGQQVLVQQEGHWAVQGKLAAIETRVPDSLQQMIERQIERLSAEDRRMLEVASVAGMEFSAAALAAGTQTETESVEERCAGLARHAHFLRALGPGEWPDGTIAARYSFLHALYQEVLYERIPAGRRQRLHQRIGERQEAAYDKRAREIAAELAVHFEQGRDYPKAVQYLQYAGENALQRSAYQETITLLTKGLELLKALPDTLERGQQELTLQIALGVPLMAMKGFSAPEVGAVYRRARELCQHVGETPQLFPVLWGLWSFYAVRAELQTAQELGERCLRLARKVQDPALLVEAHYALEGTLAHLGEATLALEHFEQVITLYNPQQHRSLAFRYGGLDPEVLGRGYAAWLLWFLGYPDQALARSHEALASAQGLAHPFSLVWALIHAAHLHLQRREGHLAQERAEAAIRLASEHGCAHELAVGTIMRGFALAEQGQSEEGVALMRQGLDAHRATGAEIARPINLARLAEVYGKVGQVEEGLRVLAEALAVVDSTGQRVYEAEVHRLRGELTLAQSSVQSLGSSVKKGSRSKAQSSKLQNSSTQPLTPSTSVEKEAETCFLKAIEIARRQSAKSLELRAAMSLARLWQRQGKHHEARNTLSEVYNWFTEGFDTKDIREAQALLDSLASSL
jgi:DNA-binding winged helix-turn-helix (wHTH) protein/predicted ATPase